MLDNRKIKGVGFIYTVCCVASVVYAKDAPKERPNFVCSWRKMFPSII